MGIRFLSPALRQPIYSIYGFVRFADEIVDSFHHADKAVLFERFKQDTENALNERISLNPIFARFPRCLSHVQPGQKACRLVPAQHGVGSA